MIKKKAAVGQPFFVISLLEPENVNGRLSTTKR